MKVGVCMIVKDESHIIHEVLQCVKDLIDTWCIVDTGSTDQTIDAIKAYCKDAGKMLYLQQTLFVNFEDARNK
jgi:glycosyltransferase involved in cell wall biosynthesis